MNVSGLSLGLVMTQYQLALGQKKKNIFDTYLW